MPVVNEKEALIQANRLLSTHEAGKILGVSKTALFAYLRSKKDPIPSFKIGKYRRFKLDQLNWWIAKHEQ